MNAQHWDQLKKNWTFLLEQYPDEVLCHLFQKNVISSNEYQKINSYATNHKKNEKLLFILKAKPAHVNAFQEFNLALRENTPWLAEQILATETNSDPSLSSKVDPNILNDEASMVLHKNYHSRQRSTVLLADIRNCLKTNGVFKDYCEWNNGKLICFIMQEFTAVKYVKRTRMFENLCTNESIIEPVPEAIHGSQSDSVIQNSSLCCPSTLGKNNSHQRVSRYHSSSSTTNINTGVVHRQLSLPNNSTIKSRHNHNISLHNQNNYSSKNANMFNFNKNLQWNGARQTLKKSNSFVCPSMPNCHKSNGDVPMQFKVNSDVQVPLTELLPFESHVKHSDTYIHGQCIKLSHCNNQCKLTQIKNFHLVPDNAEDFIAKEVVKFAAACLNDRQNGTVYFGLDTIKKKFATSAKIVGVHISTDTLKKTIAEFIQHSFVKKCWDTIHSTVREPRFVPLVNSVGQRTSRYVIEVDIIPISFSVGDSIFWTKPYLENKRTRYNHKSLYTFSKFGVPEAVKLNVYKKVFEQHVESRQKEEKEIRAKLTGSTICTRLLCFVTVFIMIVLFIVVVAMCLYTHNELLSKPIISILTIPFSYYKV